MPSQRYSTAHELAQELDLFLRDEPIRARPVSQPERAWRWCRRKPQLASMGAVAIVALVLGFAGVLWEWRQAEAGRLAARRNAYALSMRLAQEALKGGNPGRALELLREHRPAAKSESDLRGFEWRYLWQECQDDTEALVGTLSSRIRSLDVSRDGRWLAAGSEHGEVKAWNLAMGQEITVLPEQGCISHVAISPDSSELIYTDQSYSSFGTLRAWNTRTGQRRTLLTHSELVGRPIFSTDGKWLFYGKVDAQFHRIAVVIDYPTLTRPREKQSLTSVTDNYHGADMAFTTDSRSLIFSECDPDRRIVCWNFSANGELRHFRGHGEAIVAMAVNPTDPILATGAAWTDPNIKLWELPSFRSLGELSGHEGWIAGLAFSPDGQTLASASVDQTVRLWDLASRKQKWASRRLPAEVWRVCFTPDGRTLFGACNDGSIHRWSLAPRPQQPPPRHNPSNLENFAVAAKGERLAAIRQGEVWLGDTDTGALAGPIRELGSSNLSLRFSVNGKWLLVGNRSRDIRIWSVAEHKLEHLLQLTNSPVLPVTRLLQDAQGQSLVVVQCDGWTIIPGRPCRIGLWKLTEQVADWREERSWIVPGFNLACALSPNGNWLATGDPWGPVQVWDLNGPIETHPPSFPFGTTTDLAFSPDGRFLAASNEEGAVKIWQLPSLREVAHLRAHAHRVYTLAFSPDGRRLVTADAGQEAVKFWDVSTWQELIALPREGETIMQLAFSADGSRLFARNSQGDLVQWGVPTFDQIAEREKRAGGAR